MLVRIHVRADLHAAQTELADATLQFARRQLGILQRNCAQPGKTRRMRAHDLGDVIVEVGGKDRAHPPASPNS